MSRKRFRGALWDANEEDSVDVRSPFIKDADRIIYSSAFRRLQDKTQVHTFPESDYVRTRLTHSLEVTSVGRTLGMAVGKYLVDKHQLNRSELGKDALDASDFGAAVVAACLAHDIGNPPFGHAGEYAIRHWFTHDYGRDLLTNDLTDAEKADLTHFEGNAQGFRTVTRLQGWREGGGLELSCATIAAFSKYPYSSIKTAAAGSPVEPRGKFGYFQHDREAFTRVARTVGLLEREGEVGAWHRHPLVHLVESADDICYLIVDIEDAYKSKKITFAKAEGFLKAIAAGHLNRYHLVFTDDDRIAYLRAKAIGVLAGQAFKAFWDNDEEICRGRFTGSLLDYVSSADTIREIRTFAREELYTDPRKLEAEVAGFEVIRGLLEFYCETLQSWETTGRQLAKMPERYRRAIRLLPNYVSLPATKYQWLLRITDYVSGMTDRFAVKQFRNLKGIRLGLDRILFNAALAQNKCLLFWRKAFAVHPGKRGISTAH